MTTPANAAASSGGQRLRRYATGSVANMARSLLVILALVAALVAIVPRSEGITQPAVDVASVVSYAVKESGSAFEAPVGVGDGWKATTARYAASTDSVKTWQAVWTTPTGQSVALKQAVGATAGWLAAATSQATPTGSAALAGRTWERRQDAREQTHLVLSSPSGLTTVVSGTGGMEEIGQFVAALQPAAPAA